MEDLYENTIFFPSPYPGSFLKPNCILYAACPDIENNWYRWQQTNFILNTIKYTTPYMFGPDTDFVIVGGDFNTEPRGKGWESKY